MSEYQYYEFQAIDRPLTDQEQHAVQILIQLQASASYQGKEDIFQEQIRHIYMQYSRRTGLLRRLQRAGLQNS